MCRKDYIKLAVTNIEGQLEERKIKLQNKK